MNIEPTGEPMRFNKLLLAVGALVILISTSIGNAAAPTGPGPFVQDLADRVLAIFNNPQFTLADKERRMYEIAVASFDVPRSARFTLGRYWAGTPAQQRTEYQAVFEHYMVHIYASQFNLYHDVDFTVTSTRTETETRSLVRTKITRHDGRPPIVVDWWVDHVGGSYKILDVSVEGVSQLITLREQFAEVIIHNDGSVAALIAELRQKTAE
jgi:phospholipid transport system substrate-binding protein